MARGSDNSTKGQPLCPAQALAPAEQTRAVPPVPGPSSQAGVRGRNGASLGVVRLAALVHGATPEVPKRGRTGRRVQGGSCQCRSNSRGKKPATGTWTRELWEPHEGMPHGAKRMGTTRISGVRSQGKKLRNSNHRTQQSRRAVRRAKPTTPITHSCTRHDTKTDTRRHAHRSHRSLRRGQRRSAKGTQRASDGGSTCLLCYSSYPHIPEIFHICVNKNE